MHIPSARCLALAAILLVPSISTAASAPDSGLSGKQELLSNEIRRLSESFRKDDAENQQAVAQASRALREGQFLLAVQRTATIRAGLSASTYSNSAAARVGKDERQFEAEWSRVGETLKARWSSDVGRSFADVRPAFLRALAEAASPKVRIYYDTSLDYGQNTAPAQGLYYLGAAQASSELLDFYRKLSSPSSPAPTLRSLRPELDSLEDAILAAYRPPPAIERHGEFIGLSATLKEARELDDAGLRYGALLRYLQAAQRFAVMKSGASTGEEALRTRVADLSRELSGETVDHSIGRLFLEIAREELESAKAGPSAVAAAIANDVLPRYFAALRPAPPEAPKPPPQATITLVRWPYT